MMTQLKMSPEMGIWKWRDFLPRDSYEVCWNGHFYTTLVPEANIEKMPTEKLSEELERFLNFIFSGNEPNTEKCDLAKRFVYSIGQDVCCTASQGGWTLSKQILICVTFRNLYRSKQLTKILNKLCHFQVV